MTPPIGSRKKVYEDHEREVIDPFKDDYMKATTPAERKSVAQNLIFPALFSHWSEIGVDLNPEEENRRSEALLKWLRNVWRVKRNITAKPGSRYRLTDVLWWTREEKVFEEIASILNLESANTRTPGWFQLRTKASKRILDSMSEDERNDLENEADRMRKEGLPQDVQRKIADDKWYSRLTAGAKTNFKEMGLVQLSICVYTRKDGSINVNIHDDIAKFLGVPAMPFDVMFEEKAVEMKRNVLQYLQILRRVHINNTESPGEEIINGLQPNTLQMHESGYPLAPRPESWTKVTKAEIEPIFRLYIARHYQLACRDEARQAPFERIAANTSDFIAPDYLPTGISFKDPRATKLESIIEFFKHVSQRETSHGVPNAFRFKSILSSRKKGTLLPASYKDDAHESGEDNSPPPVIRRRRRKQASVAGNTPLLSPDSVEIAESSATSPATPARVAETPGSLANVPNGLYTPEDTPPIAQEMATPTRKRGRKSRLLEPKGTPATPSSSEPRRSQRASGKGKTSTVTNPKTKKKTKKDKTKLRG